LKLDAFLQPAPVLGGGWRLHAFHRLRVTHVHHVLLGVGIAGIAGDGRVPHRGCWQIRHPSRAHLLHSCSHSPEELIGQRVWLLATGDSCSPTGGEQSLFGGKMEKLRTVSAQPLAIRPSRVSHWVAAPAVALVRATGFFFCKPRHLKCNRKPKPSITQSIINLKPKKCQPTQTIINHQPTTCTNANLQIPGYFAWRIGILPQARQVSSSAIAASAGPSLHSHPTRPVDPSATSAARCAGRCGCGAARCGGAISPAVSGHSSIHS